MADTFDNFMLHSRSYKYISNVNEISLGSGYSFVSKPTSPQLRELTLSFTGYKYYFNEDGSIDYFKNSKVNNVAALRKFYDEHNQWGEFVYNDPEFGALTVRFKEPFQCPDPILNGNGAVGDFTIILKEVA